MKQKIRRGICLGMAGLAGIISFGCAEMKPKNPVEEMKPKNLVEQDSLRRVERRTRLYVGRYAEPEKNLDLEEIDILAEMAAKFPVKKAFVIDGDANVLYDIIRDGEIKEGVSREGREDFVTTGMEPVGDVLNSQGYETKIPYLISTKTIIQPFPNGRLCLVVEYDNGEIVTAPEMYLLDEDIYASDGLKFVPKEHLQERESLLSRLKASGKL